MHVLTLCGSLRAQSSNRALLQAFSALTPTGSTCAACDLVGQLPLFNPDLEPDGSLPAEALRFRSAIRQADALVLSTPEYAHGLPGAFKNAFDWLVGDPEFPGKPVAILHLARGSAWAHDSLCEILRTMSVRLIVPAFASLSLGTNRVDAAGLLARDEVRRALQQSWTELSGALAHPLP